MQVHSRYLALILILFNCSLVSAGERLDYDQFKIYADTTKLNFVELLSLENEGEIRFDSFEGFSSEVEVYWLKLDSAVLKNADYLLLSNHFERIEAYYDKEPQPYSIAGKLVEFADRTYSKGFYRNVIALNPTEGTIYIRLICSSGYARYNRTLSHVEAVTKEDLNSQTRLIDTTITLLLGMEFIILLINVILLFLGPSFTGVSYFVLIFLSMLLANTQNQTLVDVIGTNVHTLNNIEMILGVIVVDIYALFTAFYLKVKRFSKTLFYLLVSPFSILVLLFLGVEDGFYYSAVAGIYFLIVQLVIVIALVQAWSTYRHNAIVYLLANGFPMAAAVMTALTLNNLLPHSYLTTNAVYLGIMFRDAVFTLDWIRHYFQLRQRTAIDEVRIEQLTEEKEQLRRIEELKTVFFNNASHELRTPLTLILSPLEMTLKNKELPESIKRELSLSLNNGKYLLQLVNEMLDLARLDDGKLDLIRQPTDVVGIVKKIKANFDSFAKERKQTLFIAHAAESVIAMVDHDKFEKIMINLVSNAIKYSDKKGKIFIEIAAIEDDLEVLVTDEGRGINEHEIPNIFDRYFQSVEADQTGGTGVGLSIVREFMELHDGSVACHSTYKSGTTFKLHFPKVIPHEPELGYVTSGPIEMDSSHPTLLLVEDHAEMRGYLKEKLENFNVLTAGNGSEALSLLKLGQLPDLILTDYMMPEMDGYQFAHSLKSNAEWCNIPIIFLTAKTLNKDKIKVLNLGVDDYLIKPFNLDVLKVRIDKLLEIATKRKDFVKHNLPDLSIEKQQSFKNELDTYLLENLQNTQLSNTDLAYHFTLSERNLYRRVKLVTGQPPASYVREIRLQKARMLLESETEMTITQVAFECGMENLAHFSQMFKKRFGSSPKSFNEAKSPDQLHEPLE